jgi:hypothetical protein
LLVSGDVVLHLLDTLRVEVAETVASGEVVGEGER